MATINASSVEKVKADAVPIQMLSPDELRGRIRLYKMQYTWLAGYVDIGSTITGPLLPKGARIVGGFLHSQAMVASGALAVAINSVAVCAASVIGAANVTVQLPDPASVVGIVGIDSGGYPVVITTSGAAAVAGNKVTLHLFYVVD
jgi:hypothetical protein